MDIAKARKNGSITNRVLQSLFFIIHTWYCYPYLVHVSNSNSDPGLRYIELVYWRYEPDGFLFRYCRICMPISHGLSCNLLTKFYFFYW